MQKTAQKRSILNKLREMTNVSGQAAEKFFNPQFKAVMESLRAKDDQIRSLVAGAPIGDGDPGSDPVALKDLLKSAKSNLNRREYMVAVAELGRFHKRFSDINRELDKLKFDIDAVHHQFLFGTEDEPILNDEQKKHLHDLKSRFARTQRMELIKEAGIMDFFYNIGTRRGRALSAWEKRYPKETARLKKDTTTMLVKSEAALSQILSTLKEMASARSVRNPEQYTKFAEKITKSYQSYDGSFKEYYNTNIKGWLDKVELVAPTEPISEKESDEIATQKIPVGDVPSTEKDNFKIPMLFGPDKSTEVSRVPSQVDTDIESMPPTMDAPSSKELPYAATMPSPGMQVNTPRIPPAASVPTIPSPPPAMSGPMSTQPSSAAPSTIPSPPPAMSEPGQLKSDQLAKEFGWNTAHTKFLSSLESLSNESPFLLASYIAKYARSIQSYDTATAIKLLKIAKNIRG
jgi:hypothetical protein